MINKREIEILLKEGKKLYPEVTVQDFIKLFYQNEMGGGHLVTDKKQSLARIEEEAFLAGPKHLRVEQIGGGLARIYLGRIPQISLETVNKMFIISAEEQKGSLKILKEKLLYFAQLCENDFVTLPSTSVLQEVQRYIKNGCPMIGHSEIYREVYKPAYRLVKKDFADYLSLFEIIEKNLSNDKRMRIAIEGGSASGKTTVAKRISQLYDANIFHTDDFFLQEHQRTEARFREIGGNVDYERFEKQIIQGILSEKDFVYDKFDCRTMDFGEQVIVKPKRISVVEGVYSTHPKLTPIYNWRVFLDIDALTQLTRLEQREPTEKIWHYLEDWIPKERMYFQKNSIKESSNQVFTEQ